LQVSANYITYGYAPIRGAAITSAPANVTTAAGFRVVYESLLGFEPESFTYSVVNTATGVNSGATHGIVDVVSSDGVLVDSQFHFDGEDWVRTYIVQRHVIPFHLFWLLICCCP
jgi:hypothetical protein